MKEANFMRQVMLDMSLDSNTMVFRANVGMGWASEHKPIYNPDKSITLINARPLKTGLPKGFPDVFGVKTMTITPDMVGDSVGVFVGVEIKQEKGRATKEQLSFNKMLKHYGGIALIHRPSDGDINERLLWPKAVNKTGILSAQPRSLKD